MSLPPGTQLGAYEIVALVGAGGMGEVYRARDTRLQRTVAIKVLPTTLAGDPQLRERFEREARVISSLNHPNICTLFDVGHDNGRDYLVLEYLEGTTLAQRLDGGVAFAPREALSIAIEICGALDRAHRSGIIHRDLKPANVFLVRRGASTPPFPKLLDFGLAKSKAAPLAVSGLSLQPTTPPDLTAQGTILGTLQYMAPEQVEGFDIDARTDIFAFGALLFEMLTGRRAFEGETPARVLGAILKDAVPPVSHLRPGTPALLDRIVATCLEKDPDERYQSARDLLRDLRWVESEWNALVTPAAPSSRRSNRLAWTIAALAALALTVLAVLFARTDNSTRPAAPLQFTISPPEDASFGGPLAGGTGSATQVAISPDGQNIAFVAGSAATYRIWLRPMSSLVPRPVAGTEGGSFPFWSPDGRFVAFFAGGKLKKFQVTGGPPVVICDAPSGRGGTWNRDNVIVFTSSSTRGGLARVSGAGGTPTPVTTLDPSTGETNHRWPHFLPGGRHFLYTAVVGTCCPAMKPGQVRVGSLDAGDADVTLLQAESAAIYSSGHLLFNRDDTLMAQRFDADTRRIEGDPFPVVESVSNEGSRYISASVSETGTLVYGHGGSPAPLQLTWVDRTGRVLGTFGEAQRFISRANLALSPDERRVAVALGSSPEGDAGIWTVDIARGVRSRQTADVGVTAAPVFSPDGSRIAFEAARSGTISLRQKLLDSTATDEALLEPSTSSGAITQNMTPTDWSHDGRYIAYTQRASSGSSDVWVLPLFGDRRPFPIVQTPSADTAGMFSPDGRWIAYMTAEGGQSNVFVQPFPRGGERYQVSRDGGSHPVWRADGRELFYLASDGTMMAVPIDATDRFSAGVPQMLFQTTTGTPRFTTSNVYATTRDGKRFVMIARPQRTATAALTVVVNWPAAIPK